MKNALVILALAAILMAGCFGSAPPAPPAQNGTTVPPAANNTTAPTPALPGGNVTPPPPTNGTGGAPQPAPPGGTPAPQVDCATLTPDCNSCIAKAGCGWCKSSNGCFSGDASGPAGTQCQPADWSVTAAGCQAPTSPQGTKCSEQVGCGSCLTGEGCKFCRQGAVCADVSSTDSCFGGWITDYYVCAAGSQ